MIMYKYQLVTVSGWKLSRVIDKSGFSKKPTEHNDRQTDFIEALFISIRKLRMRNYWFPIRKRGFFCSGKEI